MKIYRIEEVCVYVYVWGRPKDVGGLQVKGFDESESESESESDVFAR